MPEKYNDLLGFFTQPWYQFKNSNFRYWPPRLKFKTNKAHWAKQ